MYNQYRGRSVGRILHFLYYQCGLTVAEHAVVGNGKITFYGKLFATYTWERNTDNVVFNFVDSKNNYGDRQRANIDNRCWNEDADCWQDDYEQVLKAINTDGFVYRNKTNHDATSYFVKINKLTGSWDDNGKFYFKVVS